MKNIHILPTDKPSKLQLQMNGNFHLENGQSIALKSYQNIYITNDEEISIGNFMLELDTNFVLIAQKKYIDSDNYKKIILTTDQSLDGVQAIDDEFLEWFVKNPSCEWVNIEKDRCLDTSLMCDCVDEPCRNKGYKIIIPKEECIGFIDGFKLAQERSYSEEEVLEMLKELEIECVINPRRTEIKEWFKQFKKK
jgi:hypothetical protein